MPADLKAALQPFVPKLRAVEMKTVDALPEQVALTSPRWQRRQQVAEPLVELTVRETQWMAQQDLLAVLWLVEAGQVRVTAKTQRPTAATIRAVGEILFDGDYYPPPDPAKEKNYFGPTEPDSMRAFAWPLLVQSANLAEVAGAKLQLTSAGKKALTAPPRETLRTLWKSWLKTTLLDEFNRVKTIKGQSGQGADAMTAPSGRRKVIAGALPNLPVNTWVAFDEFSRYMQADGHTFTVSRDLWTLYIEEANYGSLGYEGFGDWHIVQARYLLVFLMEYAATLGLLDITVAILFQEMAEKVAKLSSMTAAYLIAVNDPQTIQLLTHDSRLAKVCWPAGEQHVVVPAQSLSAFRRALHELGYALPPNEG